MRAWHKLGVSPKLLRARLTAVKNYLHGTTGYAVVVSCMLLFTAFIFVGAVQELLALSFLVPSNRCVNTAQGKDVVTDDRGVVCSRNALDTSTGCCLRNAPGARAERFSCAGCDKNSACCAGYEHCVSCCLDPRSLATRQRAILAETVSPILKAAADQPFEFCRALCRTSSDSLTPTNKYRGEQRFCYGRAPDAVGLGSSSSSARSAAPTDASSTVSSTSERGVGLPDDWLKQWMFATSGAALSLPSQLTMFFCFAVPLMVLAYR